MAVGEGLTWELVYIPCTRTDEWKRLPEKRREKEEKDLKTQPTDLSLLISCRYLTATPRP
jgi:hypothetical protein